MNYYSASNNEAALKSRSGGLSGRLPPDRPDTPSLGATRAVSGDEPRLDVSRGEKGRQAHFPRMPFQPGEMCRVAAKKTGRAIEGCWLSRAPKVDMTSTTYERGARRDVPA